MIHFYCGLDQPIIHRYRTIVDDEQGDDAANVTLRSHPGIKQENMVAAKKQKSHAHVRILSLPLNFLETVDSIIPVIMLPIP